MDLITSYLDYVRPFKGSTRFHTWSIISVAAAMLERRVWFELGGLGVLYPNQYICLVGGPGSGKTTSSNMAVKLIHDYNKTLGPANGGIKFGPDKTTPAALLERFQSVTKTIKDVPTIGDMEQSALYVHTTELSTYIKDIGGGAMADDMLKLYDCEATFEKEIKNGGQTLIKGPCLNFLADTTPEFLSRYLPGESSGTGFTARIIFAGEFGKVPKDPVVPKGDEALRAHVLGHIGRMHRMKGPMRFSAEAEHFWNQWFYEQEDKLYNFPDGSFLKYFYARKQPHVRKLAMTLSAGRTNERVISLEDLTKAIELIEEAEPFMVRCFGVIDINRVQDGTKSILTRIPDDKYIAKAHLLQALFAAGLSGGNNFIEAHLKTLVEAQLVDCKIEGDQIYYKRLHDTNT